MVKSELTTKKKKTAPSGDCDCFSPRRNRRGIFLACCWRFEGGKLTMKFSKSGSCNHWRFKRSRLPGKYARHGERGENRTNSCKSKTRHGSDAVCRYMKFASPHICYENFYYLKFSDHGGGGSDVACYNASRSGRVVICHCDLDALNAHRGHFLHAKTNKNLLTTSQNQTHRRHNVSPF